MHLGHDIISSTMAHIAINAHLLAPDSGYRQAGIHRYIYNVLTHLPHVDEALHYTALLHHPLNHPDIEEQRSKIDTSKPWKRILWEQLIQPFALRQIKPDLYHALAFVIPRGLPCPSVVTIYDLSFVRYPELLSSMRRHYLQRFTRSSCQRATRIIAISESTAQDIVEYWGIRRDKIDVIHLAVSPEFRPMSADEANRPPNSPSRFLLFLGTLEPRKNLPMLIRAYAGLPAEVRENVHLVLAGGKGWMYEEIFATITSHNLEDMVHTPGYIPAEELVLWYNAADALVYPTLYEGFGFPILEAMACGKPVLASNTSSLPEAAGDIGVLLPPDDETAWTTAMLRAIEDNSWRESIRPRALDWAARFTWERTTKQTIESYYRALE